eukprot:5191877-Alexandrium_andersonii.AAC.1
MPHSSRQTYATQHDGISQFGTICQEKATVPNITFGAQQHIHGTRFGGHTTHERIRVQPGVVVA